MSPVIWLLLFVTVPVVELAVIMAVGDVLGLGLTLLLLFGDGIVGAWLVRREGRRAWQAFHQALTDGRWPGDEVAQGGLLLVGGALLLTPGFVTDVVGLAAVLSPTRRLIAALVRTRLRPTGGGATAPGQAGSARDASGQTVFDVEVLSVEVDEQASGRADDDPELGPGSGDGTTP